MPSKKQSAASKQKKAKSTASKATKSSASVTPTPVETTAAATPEPAAATTPTATPVDNALTNIESGFASLASKITEFKALHSSITSELRALQKQVQKHLKESARKNRRRKQNTDGAKKRAPSGFAKPALISDELCGFLGKPSGTEMARTEVTKFLTNYIKEHSLQDQANKRRILPDKKLSSLLNVPAGDELTYFNLQKYMKVHFPKSQSATTTA